MNKTVRIAGWILLGVFILFTFYFMWKQSQPKPVEYELITPVFRDIVKRTVATGTIEARTQVELKPQVNGIITELRIDAGDMVRTGDIVAVIRIIPDMSQLNQAQGKLNQALIDLDEKQKEFDRTEVLYTKGVLSKEEYEQTKSRLDIAKETLETARSQVEVITLGASSRSGNVNTTYVLSTMNGIVLSVPVKVGSPVSSISMFSPGTTVAKVADMSDVIFKGSIDETEVAKLTVGMSISLQIGSMQDVFLPAVLEYISPEGVMSNGAKMFEIKADVQVPQGIVIRNGYSVNAYIELSRAENVISTDETAVEFTDDGTFVYKLISKDDIGEQIFERVPVTVGISDGIYIQILDGVDTDMKLRGNRK